MITFQTKIILLGVFIAHSLFAADPPRGSVVCWGYVNWDSEAPSSLRFVTVAGEHVTNAISIAAGDGHGLALRSDGTVVGFGFDGYGQTIGTSSSHSDMADGIVKINGEVLSNVVAIAAGGNHSLALRRDGTVIGWGSHVVPTGLSNIAAIATGYVYSMGVRRDGTVLSLGGGDMAGWRAYPDHREGDYVSIFEGTGNSKAIEGLSNAVLLAIAVDASAGNLALKRDGTVVGWGAAADVPAGLSNVVAIAGGPRHNLALKKDGTVTMWGGYRVNQLAAPPGLRNVEAIAVGMNFFLAITNNTTLATNR
jgi:alpha-tubulin suppressor-like RCC1 family protein